MASLASQFHNRLGLLSSYVMRRSRVPGGPLTLAIESGNDVIFNFGDDDILTIRNVSEVQLTDDILVG